jgi:hypothetical protein
MEILDIQNLLGNIERKVYQQEITSSTDITNLVNSEIAKAINLKNSAGEEDESLYKNVSCTTVECYLDHLKAVEEKLKTPNDLTAQCTLVEEREINRRLMLILNRIKGYSRKE